jgi:hypothetical protein
VPRRHRGLGGRPSPTPGGTGKSSVFRETITAVENQKQELKMEDATTVKSTYWTRLSDDDVVTRYDDLVDIYLERQLTARQHKQRDALEAEMERRGVFASP